MATTRRGFLLLLTTLLPAAGTTVWCLKPSQGTSIEAYQNQHIKAGSFCIQEWDDAPAECRYTTNSVHAPRLHDQITITFHGRTEFTGTVIELTEFPAIHQTRVYARAAPPVPH